MRQLAHTAFEHIAHAKFATDLLNVDLPALVGESRVARDDEKPFDARQAGDNVVNHTFGEVLLSGVSAQI
jgi:hypothetical protein